MEFGPSFRQLPRETSRYALRGSGSSPERAEVFERVRLLQDFRPLFPQDTLADVARHRERSLQPERSLWDAVELMMRDEKMRDRLLVLMDLPDKEGRVREEKAELYSEYRKTIAGYQALVELVDTSTDRTLAEREIIPHTRLGNLRLRLADLLANIPFYFPDEEHTLQDKQQAFSRLSEALYAPGPDGLQAEVALVGLLRYGPEWLQGKESAEEAHLSPSMFIERTMPREDVLRPISLGVGRKAGQFNGHDLIYRAPGEKHVRSVQIKTGKMEDKPWYVHLPALELIGAYERIAASSGMRGSAKREAPGVFERSKYYNALQQTIMAFPFDDATRAKMKRLFMPSVGRTRQSEPPPPPGWTVSWQAVKQMLDTNDDFKRFAQREGMPLVADQKDFQRWSSFLMQARAMHAQEDFWQAWPERKTTTRTKASSRAVSSRAASNIH